MALLAIRGLPLGAKARLYSVCVSYIMLYGSGTWVVKEEDAITLEGNDARMVRLMVRNLLTHTSVENWR